MSVHVISWVLKHSEEKLGRRLVLLSLADHANEDGGGAWPSVATIARDARLSERQVQRCLRELEAAGSIRRAGKSPHGTVTWAVEMSGGDNLSGVTSTTFSRDKMSPEPSLEPSLERASTSEANASLYETLAQPAEKAPPLHKIDGRDIAFDALRRECEIPEGDRNGERQVATALNGRKGQLTGIRQMSWEELVRGKLRGDYVEAHEVVAATPEAFENMLVALIQRRCAAYRRAWEVDLTPTALARWWLTIEAKARAAQGGGLSSAEMAAADG